MMRLKRFDVNGSLFQRSVSL